MRSAKIFARLRCGGNLPLCLAFGTGVLGVLWWLGGWVVGIRYRRGASLVRNMRAVLKKASWGTRRIFRRLRCKKQASTVRKRYSVPKTGSSGTRRIFKGPQNSTCHIERVSKGAQNSLLPTGRIFSARNGPRSEVSKYKKRVRLKALVGPPFFPVLPEQLLCAELYSLMHLTEYASALLPAPLADAVMPFASVLKARQANPNPVALVSSLVFGELLQ